MPSDVGVTLVQIDFVTAKANLSILLIYPAQAEFLRLRLVTTLPTAHRLPYSIFRIGES